MSLPPFDIHHEATGCVNELYYGQVVDKHPLRTDPRPWPEEAVEIIERCMREAVEAALSSRGVTK